jgi:iron complex outermembrane receptor protein
MSKFQKAAAFLAVLVPTFAALADAMILEEILVTARKRVEPLAQVPASVTIMDADQLAAIGATRLQDAALRLPNYATNQSPLTPFAQQYVRGLNAAARNIGFDSGFGVFIDGVYAGRYAIHNRSLGNVERLEYLPGPQGTLFGKNTTLGVLNVVTAAPAEDLTAEFQAGLGNLGGSRLRAGFSTPVGEGWAIGIYGGRRERDGIVENTFTGTSGNNIDEWDGSLRLDGMIGATRLTLSADVFESTPDLIARQRVRGLGALPPREASHDFDGMLDEQDYGFSLRLAHDFSWGELTSITGYRVFESTADIDDDAYEMLVQHLLGWSESQDQFTQEVRLDGTVDRAGYLVGVYYQQQDIESFRGLQSGPVLGDVAGELQSESMAVFGNVTYAFSDRVDGELGLRWSKETKDLASYVQNGGGFLIDFSTSDDRSVDTVTPTVSLSWQATPSVRTFARYARGFKSGGFNVDIVTSPAITPLEFDDEVVDSFELGFKSVLLGKRMRVGMTAFYAKYDDLQVSQFEFLPGALLPTLRVTNAASATSKGFEGNLDLLMGSWSTTASLGYANAKVDDFPDPLGPGTGNYSGNSLGGPKWTANVLTSYARPIGRMDLTLIGEYLFQDRLGGDLNDDPRGISDPLSLVNLRASLEFGTQRRWRLTAWVDNVLDTTKVIELQQNPAAGLLAFVGFPPEVVDSSTGLYNAPRTYGVELGFAF